MSEDHTAPITRCPHCGEDQDDREEFKEHIEQCSREKKGIQRAKNLYSWVFNHSRTAFRALAYGGLFVWLLGSLLRMPVVDDSFAIACLVLIVVTSNEF